MRNDMMGLVLVLSLTSCAQEGSAIADEPAAVATESERVDMSGLDLARAPSRGSSRAPVTVTVFCDFECRYCRRLKPRLDELERTHRQSIQIVFKQLPLPMHEHSRLAAKAALAAQNQGRFWELGDLMFQSDEPLDRDRIETLATRAGLDLERFQSDLESKAIDQRLERDLTDADRVGARGTPTTFINGKRISGAQPLEDFEKAVEEALAR